MSVEHSDAQLVAAFEEGGADETAQTGLAETLPADETKSMPVEITDEDSQNITDTSEDAQDAQVEECGHSGDGRNGRRSTCGTG